jgi:hypothetical protein
MGFSLISVAEMFFHCFISFCKRRAENPGSNAINESDESDNGGQFMCERHKKMIEPTEGEYDWPNSSDYSDYDDEEVDNLVSFDENYVQDDQVLKSSYFTNFEGMPPQKSFLTTFCVVDRHFLTISGLGAENDRTFDNFINIFLENISFAILVISRVFTENCRRFNKLKLGAYFT